MFKVRAIAVGVATTIALLGHGTAQATATAAGEPTPAQSLTHVAAQFEAPASGYSLSMSGSRVNAGSISLDLPADPQSRTRGRGASEVGLKARSKDTDFVVQEMESGTRVLSVSKSRLATTELTYRIGSPARLSLSVQPDGSVQVLDGSGTVTATIETPWAYDAQGVAVPTHFTVKGDQLTQVVEHRGAGVTYPVTADPSVISCSTFVACLKFNRSETLRVNNAAITGGVAGMVGTLCGLIPSSPWYLLAFKATCAGYVAANYSNIRANSQTAANTGRCLALRFSVPGGFPLGSQVVSC